MIRRSLDSKNKQGYWNKEEEAELHLNTYNNMLGNGEKLVNILIEHLTIQEINIIKQESTITYLEINHIGQLIYFSFLLIIFIFQVAIRFYFLITIQHSNKNLDLIMKILNLDLIIEK
ncbi:unnamed protein product [Paramecium primaurelia]|uniref:Uncharacterized protein n=1 Tax=Paramecium primaurelia TaxID=5886 RepID=A0A8S1NJ96_PARPR|nr:unnamed protein product [Paramecium primaurelia]